MFDFKKYVDEFNANDKDYVVNAIDNAHVYEWMKDEIPVFECPEKDLEKTYYFRWWTFRKHIKDTDKGYLISEFLPPVFWGGKYNVIVAAAGHHVMEGRWLKNSDKYLKDYMNYFLVNKDEGFLYSQWLIWAANEFDNVTGKLDIKSFLENAKPYYNTWDEKRLTACGLYKSIDDRDAMEYSISGTHNLKAIYGVRPTLNSYMYADAMAIYEMSKKIGEPLEEYKEKAEHIRELILKLLWKDDFFKAIHPLDGDFSKAECFDTSDVPRELIGYIPFYFGIPDKSKEFVFDLLGDEKVFKSNIGLTTAEMGDPRFLYEVNHECLWNGYVWPFATSQVLSGLLNARDKKYKKLFYELLLQYARQHHRIDEDGKNIMWIDEVRAPYEDSWTSREVLKSWGWRANKGGFERGKDYNHSTFCDLVISGIAGVRATADSVSFDPIIPEDWDYFRMDKLNIKGKVYCLEYDKTGEKYGKKGLHIYCDGKEI